MKLFEISIFTFTDVLVGNIGLASEEDVYELSNNVQNNNIAVVLLSTKILLDVLNRVLLVIKLLAYSHKNIKIHIIYPYTEHIHAYGLSLSHENKNDQSSVTQSYHVRTP